MIPMVRKIRLMDGWEIERQFVRHLNTHQNRDHCLYLGDCSRSWLQFETANEFSDSHKLTDLLRDHIDLLAESMGSRHLLSVGITNTVREALILQHMTQSPPLPRQYVCVDINEGGLNRAAGLAQTLNIEALCVIAMSHQLRQVRKFCKGPVVLAMLGNHFCNYDPTELLQAVNTTLDSDDLLLFDCALFSPDAQQMIDVCNCHLKKLRNIVPLLNRGVTRQDYELELKLSKRHVREMEIHRTEKQVTFRSDCRIATNSEPIDFKPDDTIQMGFTFRYEAHQILALVDDGGFDILQTHLDRDHENLLVLAKRKRP